MLYLKVFILAIIQGLTEFLPISSTAHLVIFSKFLNFNENFVIYQIMTQFGSVLALVIFFRKKLFEITFSLYKSENSRNFSYKIILAFLPCAVVGFLFYKYIKTYFYTNLIIAVMLIIGGIIFLILNKANIKTKYNNVEQMTKLSAFKIGLYQILSVIPGVSRSGSTIVGGLLSNLSRKTAVEFSFLLAIPTVFLASLYDLYKNINNLQIANVKLMIFAALSTFLISMLVVKWFLDYISNHDFKIFGYYRIILGLLIIIMSL